MNQEAWLSGEIEGVPLMLLPAAHALRQAAIDIEQAVRDLSRAELWLEIKGAPPVGFHLLHIEGSIDRLLTYARGEKLTAAQFAALAAENEAHHSLDAHALALKTSGRIEQAIDELKSTPEEILFEKRTVGRKNLPTNVFGLLFHIAEHTQRHTGQIVTTAGIVRRMQSSEVNVLL